MKFHLTNIYKKMNVKSRAQLIVWCLPHLGFVENETNQPARPEMSLGAGSATAINTIPVGNQPVAPTSNVTPIRSDIGTGTNSGNGDMGAFGL